MKLIDADGLLDYLNAWKFAICPNDKMTDEQVTVRKIEMFTISDCMSYVATQPTAYDVDKVVGELILESIHQSNNASIIGTKDAIDIVKRGGVEDE